MFKTLLATTAFAAFALPAQAVTVVQWDFESAIAPAASTSWTNIAPSTGSGNASTVHAATATFSTPAGNGSAKSVASNTWSVGDYWQFNFSTSGFTGVSVTFDQAGSNTGPRDFTFAYSSNGGTSFTNFANYQVALSTWSAGTPMAGFSYTMDLSAIPALNNNANVVVRLVDASTTSINGGTVATAGTNRVDNFTVMAAVVPEPGTYALLLGGLGAIGFVARRRRG